VLVVIAIIGTLAAALFPSLTRYLLRTRDTARIKDIVDIAFSLESYRMENEKYPQHERKIESPSGIGYNEGCGANGKYGYGISTGETINILMARMENPYGGNYVSTGELLVDMTGTLSSISLGNAPYYMKRGTGSTYLFINTAGDVFLSNTTPPTPINGVCDMSVVA
jgi:type II secretory pathway pseudopilin PulG